jgi:hypothetical protein
VVTDGSELEELDESVADEPLELLADEPDELLADEPDELVVDCAACELELDATEGVLELDVPRAGSWPEAS